MSLIERLDQLTHGVAVSRASIFHHSCTLACRHCGWRDRRRKGGRTGELGLGDTKSWKSVLRWCAERGVKQVTFTGGEVTERDDFVELIREAQWLSLPILLETHGRAFSQVDRCQDISPGRNITIVIALHGASAQVHDAVTRVRGSFLDTVEGIRNLLKICRSEVDIITVLTSHNVEDLQATVELTSSLGVRRHTIVPAILRGMATPRDFPPLERLKAVLGAIIAGEDIKIEFSNVPFCMLADPIGQSINAHGVSIGLEIMIHPGDINRTFLASPYLPKPTLVPTPCVRCFYQDLCPAPAYLESLDPVAGVLRPFDVVDINSDRAVGLARSRKI